MDQNAINSQIKNQEVSNVNSVATAAPLAQVKAATKYKKKYKKYRSHKKYKTYKKYRTHKVWSSRYHRYVTVRAAYTYRTTVRYTSGGGKGTGDCWTNSAILFSQLKSQGLKVRIIQYPTSLSSRHRSVQLYQNGHWVNYNYKANGYKMIYYATSGSSHGTVIQTS
jgi:hypothetical protein